jgi:hypothetical protein
MLSNIQYFILIFTQKLFDLFIALYSLIKLFIKKVQIKTITSLSFGLIQKSIQKFIQIINLILMKRKFEFLKELLVNSVIRKVSFLNHFLRFCL